MTTVYGTLGFTPEKYLPTLRKRSDLEAAVVFHDEDERSIEAAGEVRDYCQGLDLPVTTVQVDAFDLVDAAQTMQEHVRKTEDEEIIVNVTGGTKVLTAAAILVSILEGLRTVYIHEETGEEIPLPLITARYEQLLTDAQRRVLRYVIDHNDQAGRSGGEACTQADIRDALGLSKPTVSQHVRELVDYGVLTEESHPEDARKKMLGVIPSARLLLGDDL